MRFRRASLSLGLACLMIAVSGLVCPALAMQGVSRAEVLQSAAATDNIVLQWNEATLEAIRATRLGPPMVARALAIVHTSMYDAWAAYDQVAVGTRLGGTLRRPLAEHTLANKDKAISYAAY